MQKIFIVIGAFLFILVSTNIFADTGFTIGETIYQRALGGGCGACHEDSSKPQLASLIQSGKLDIESFSNTLINGKNAMPAAIDRIMSLGVVKKEGYTEEQAINAVYRYIKGERWDESIFNAAEINFSQFFPTKQPTLKFAPYLFRFYPSTNIYLGVNTTEQGVYLLGGSFGDTPLHVGTIYNIKALLTNMILDDVLQNIQEAQDAINSNSEVKDVEALLLAAIFTASPIGVDLSNGVFSSEKIFDIKIELSKAYRVVRREGDLQTAKESLELTANLCAALQAQL